MTRFFWQCCIRKIEDVKVAATVRRSRYLEAEEAVNECSLPSDVLLRQPPDLPLANHAQCLNSLDRPPRQVKCSEALHRPDPPLDG